MDANIFSKKNIDYLIDCGILDYDDIVPSGSEVLMSKILDNVHKHKITKANDGRWSTYVPDPTKSTGLRQVKKRSKSELFVYLIENYGVKIDYDHFQVTYDCAAANVSPNIAVFRK